MPSRSATRGATSIERMVAILAPLGSRGPRAMKLASISGRVERKPWVASGTFRVVTVSPVTRYEY